ISSVHMAIIDLQASVLRTYSLPPARACPPCPTPFFFDPRPTTALYTLSLHDALPISSWLLHNRRIAKKRLCFSFRSTGALLFAVRRNFKYQRHGFVYRRFHRSDMLTQTNTAIE